MLRDYSRVEIKAGDGRSGLYHLVASKRFVKSTCSAAGDRPTGYCCKLFRDRVISGATAALSITNNDSAIV